MTTIMATAATELENGRSPKRAPSTMANKMLIREQLDRRLGIVVAPVDSRGAADDISRWCRRGNTTGGIDLPK
jgi:hypothetical protein